MYKFALALTAAFSAVFVGVAPASAEAVSSIEASAPPSASASYNCYGFHYVNGNHGWEGGCSVASGQIRTITYCTDGSNRVGGWIYARPNPWFVSGDCGSAAFVTGGIGIETRG